MLNLEERKWYEWFNRDDVTMITVTRSEEPIYGEGIVTIAWKSKGKTDSARFQVLVPADVINSK